MLCENSKSVRIMLMLMTYYESIYSLKFRSNAVTWYVIQYIFLTKFLKSVITHIKFGYKNMTNITITKSILLLLNIILKCIASQ